MRQGDKVSFYSLIRNVFFVSFGKAQKLQGPRQCRRVLDCHPNMIEPDLHDEKGIPLKRDEDHSLLLLYPNVAPLSRTGDFGSRKRSSVKCLGL